MAMQSQPVSSSAFASIQRDDETGETAITFTDGRSYIIPNLPDIEFARWMAADSIGAYFNANIRGNY